jgi:hypothetical protein
LAVAGLAARAQDDTIPPAVSRDSARVNSAVHAARATLAQLSAMHLMWRDTTYRCETEPQSEVRFWTGADSAGVIRRFIVQDGSEEVRDSSNYYYDSAGRLLYIVNEVHDVRGNWLEFRWYYDTTRTLVKKVSIEHKGEVGWYSAQPNPAFDPKRYIAYYCGD